MPNCGTYIDSDAVKLFTELSKNLVSKIQFKLLVGMFCLEVCCLVLF